MIQFFIKMTAVIAAAYFALHAPQVGGLDGADRRKLSAHARARRRGLPQRAARLHEQLGPGGRGLHHADRRAVVGGLVSRRGAGRRQLHRAAHAGVEVREATRWARCSSSTSRTTCCGRGRGSSSALCSIIVYPELSDIQRAFPNLDPRLLGHDIAYPAMLKFLPAGFVGLMVGGLIAANSSTILTHLNWGASYLVHDFYRRFIKTRRRPSALRAAPAASRRSVLFVCSSALGLPARHGEGRLRRHPAGRRRHRPAVSGALVLVARQRLVRGRRDGQLVRGVDRACWCWRRNGVARQHARRRSLLTVAVTTVCWVVDGVRRAADRSRRAGRVLPQGAAGRARAGTPIRARGRRSPPDARAARDNIPLALLGWVAGCTTIWSALFAVGNFLSAATRQALLL